MLLGVQLATDNLPINMEVCRRSVRMGVVSHSVYLPSIAIKSRQTKTLPPIGLVIP